ncbi:DUF4760 domain-containing protein [Roseovarius rhodophyticola]|uniref:DUF4760 domain-containing protein n=1 Tax=Roseovarius rhodophyticola TaxID=3080827 RepID=A0ABZ2TD05_9RHOB|nr:DUF4760 domain-containing protein [Roseovarius sp. W115]MDV2931291.1 DUF4760 domain-containing protein [Roseovarius sp. W115]
MFDNSLKVLFLFAAAVLLAAAILFFAAISTHLLTSEFDQLLRQIPDTPSEEYKVLVSLFSIAASTLTAILGLGFAIWTYIQTTRKTQQDRRKQHTITILLETRLSETYSQLNKTRKQVYPPGKDINPEQFYTDYVSEYSSTSTDAPSMDCRRSAAEALSVILNYYEFLAVGLADGDLDEAMLKKTIRGVMCRLVDDARYLIAAEQKTNLKTFEHLIDLYASWRDPNAKDRDCTPNERPVPTE